MFSRRLCFAQFLGEKKQVQDIRGHSFRSGVDLGNKPESV